MMASLRLSRPFWLTFSVFLEAPPRLVEPYYSFSVSLVSQTSFSVVSIFLSHNFFDHRSELLLVVSVILSRLESFAPGSFYRSISLGVVSLS